MRIRVHYNIYIIALLTQLTACGTEDLGQDVPIVFVPVTRDVTEASRAAGNGLERNFVVCGYKTVPQEQLYVMPKYDVTYSNGTYSYVTSSQPQIYWDNNASEYRFWGYTGNNGIESSENGTTITIPVSLQNERAATLPLYSELKLITEIDYNTVKLEFLYPVSRLSVMFYSEEPLSDGDELSVRDIAFAPIENNQVGKVSKIWNEGIVTVTYPLNEAVRENVCATQSNPSSVRDNLSFKDLTLKKDAGDKINNAVYASVSDAGSNYYYSLPMDDKNPDFVLTLKLDGETRTVIIPEQYMHWQVNHSYNYIFKISGVSKNVGLYDVQIEPWHYGGSQETVWKDW